MREFERDRDEVDEDDDGPAVEVREFVIHSDEDIVEPVLELPVAEKKKIYKPKIRKDSVKQLALPQMQTESK